MNKYYLGLILLVLSITITYADSYPVGTWLGYNADTGKFLPVMINASGTVLVEGIGGASESAIKAQIDAINEESGGATLDDSIDLVDLNYAAIKAAIASKSVDMTGIKPSGYDTAINSIVAASGDAVAADLLVGKTASTASGAITGTRVPNLIFKTGQTAVATPGDDGTYQLGAAWPDPRFVDNGNGTMTDLATGLMWKTEIQNSRSFADAISYCEGLNFAGFTDWRLPNRNEMWSILWSGVPAVARYPFPPGHFFYSVSGLDMTTKDGVWCSSTVPGPNDNATYANLLYPGIISIRAKTDSVNTVVIAVRGPIAL